MKARQANQQFSAYSPAYSPLAMSGSAGGPGSMNGGSGAQGEHNSIQSPLYMPPSMGGQQQHYSSIEQDGGSKNV